MQSTSKNCLYVSEIPFLSFPFLNCILFLLHPNQVYFEIFQMVETASIKKDIEKMN
jgi:hypothetical protein